MTNAAPRATPAPDGDGEPIRVLLDRIERRDREGATRLVAELVRDQGIDAAVAVLCATQQVVGDRWQAGVYTVADEHAASAIIDIALTTATREAVDDATGPTIVVGCVENEWHVLPARMVAEQLRARGFVPVFLGASMPVADLTEFLRSVAPAAVALSCSMTINLPGAIRSVRACHAAGVPVAIGGAAVNGAPRRSTITGADEAPADLDELAGLLRRWAVEPPEPRTDPSTDERIGVEQRASIVDLAYRRVLVRIPPLTNAGAAVHDRIRRDLERLVSALEAALMIDDPGVMIEFADWLAEVSHAAELPHGLVPVAIRAIGEAVETLGLAADDIRRILAAAT